MDVGRIAEVCSACQSEGDQNRLVYCKKMKNHLSSIGDLNRTAAQSRCQRPNSDLKKSVTPGSSGSITTFAINPTIGYNIADWLPALCPASQPKTTGAV
jgi:hypothetical protein